jgi:dihydrofolate synthase/folylpolyglutamate synthase
MRQAFNCFSECLAYLAQFTDYEKMAKVQYAQSTYNLVRIRRLLTAIGNPHLTAPAIHVAGTKGKGSTARILHFLLRAHGFSCGVYSSPHLVTLLERIRVNESDANEEEFLAAMNVLRPFLIEMYEEAEPTRPTFFEIVTAAAFLIFERRKVDFSIVEVGMGGRLDATNVLQPVASVITLIDYDHMDKLGETLANIASEKAGIIKQSVPTVTSERGIEAFPVIERTARSLEAPLFALGRDFHLNDSTGDIFEVKTWRQTYESLSLAVLGRHQRANAAMAIALLDCLASRGLVSPRPDVVRQALAAVVLPGRIELFRPREPGPFIIIDGAHNPVSMRALAETLDALRKKKAAVSPATPLPAGGFPPEKTVLVVGMSEDKQIENTLREILAQCGIVFFTASANPRAANPERLREIATRAGFFGRAMCVPHVRDALRQACAEAGQDGLVVVTGSFYVAGEALGSQEIRGPDNQVIGACLLAPKAGGLWQKNGLTG